MSQAHHASGPGRRWPQGATVAMGGSNGSEGPAEQSVHDWVYHSLRHAILYNQISPGAWLRQKDISVQFNVSRTPVREAFRTLDQEGLVELVPNYGARVTELTVEEFEEIYALRMGIEGLAARLTAEMLQPEQLFPLRQTLNNLAQLTQTLNLRDYLQTEWQFRMQCYQVTERQRLLKRVLFLREHSERYIYLAYSTETRVAESFDFHDRLLERIAANDGAQAEQILQDALQWTLRNAKPIVAKMLSGQQPNDRSDSFSSFDLPASDYS
ncbi:MAG: GntR family transcriptional regulator [Kaiparowitsia implicata GSE-PSE-MK54-09C]|jgi:DNA-binding GntR family transcriptional regulator|nr:GntR family transcriptional regulator [Kaiparowitsia implicata GSE-PSE-MK54-09C]